jgi:hypothetical protein
MFLILKEYCNSQAIILPTLDRFFKLPEPK